MIIHLKIQNSFVPNSAQHVLVRHNIMTAPRATRIPDKGRMLDLGESGEERKQYL